MAATTVYYCGKDFKITSFEFTPALPSSQDLSGLVSPTGPPAPAPSRPSPEERLRRLNDATGVVGNNEWKAFRAQRSRFEAIHDVVDEIRPPSVDIDDEEEEPSPETLLALLAQSDEILFAREAWAANEIDKCAQERKDLRAAGIKRSNAKRIPSLQTPEAPSAPRFWTRTLTIPQPIFKKYHQRPSSTTASPTFVKMAPQDTPSQLPAIFNPTSQDIENLLSAQCHLGSKNLQVHMNPYLWKTRPDGINVINVGKTWEKIVLAARIIAAIDNPADVVVISARPYGQRAVLKFAAHTGANAIAGRFTPGNFTNYITRSFKEPRLVIVTDPRTDAQAILESSYVNIPVIALCDTDSPTEYVDVAIPTNNKGRHAIGLIWWMLAREVLRLRGTIASREAEWDVMVDLYFYRDPEAEENKGEAIEDKADETAAADSGFAATGGDWEVSGPGASTAFAGASSAAAGGADWNVAGTDDWAASSGAAAAATTGGEWGAETKTSEQW